jgi:hypothetical protein
MKVRPTFRLFEPKLSKMQCFEYTLLYLLIYLYELSIDIVDTTPFEAPNSHTSKKPKSVLKTSSERRCHAGRFIAETKETNSTSDKLSFLEE